MSVERAENKKCTLILFDINFFRHNIKFTKSVEHEM